MPRSSAAQRLSRQRLSRKTREQFSVYLTEENNDLIRDYRFSLIMKTQNTELTFSDVVDQIFKEFREYLHKTDMLNREVTNKERKFRTVITFLPEDKKLMQEYRLKRMMISGDVNFSLTNAFNEIVDIFRTQLQSKGFKIMKRPDIVRASEQRLVSKDQNEKESI